jgi:hypothetical protein
MIEFFGNRVRAAAMNPLERQHPGAGDLGSSLVVVLQEDGGNRQLE